jgi:hypothetical protein
MNERGIIFSAPMVLAIIEGRKTQTRRVIQRPYEVPDFGRLRCPYGMVDHVLWVRETWGYRKEQVRQVGASEDDLVYRYKADGDYISDEKWHSPRFMPRSASRLRLRIEEVRVQRVQDISEEDSAAEGCDGQDGGFDSARAEFESLWDRINGKLAPWDSNPWVWVLRFKVIK